MIVLKDLAREFDADPHKVRQILRKHFPSIAAHPGRWQWPTDDDPHLVSARKLLQEYFK